VAASGHQARSTAGGAVATAGIAARRLPSLDRFRKGAERFRVGHFRNLAAALFIEVVEADATFLLAIVRRAPFPAIEHEGEAVGVF